MAKWADYGIYDVIQDEDGSITKVKYKEDIGESFVHAGILTKTEVIRKIENGETFITYYKENGSEKVLKGQMVRVVKGPNSKKYIRSDANETPKDNLEFGK